MGKKPYIKIKIKIKKVLKLCSFVEFPEFDQNSREICQLSIHGLSRVAKSREEGCSKKFTFVFRL
jgi:hypothetical protein